MAVGIRQPILLRILAQIDQQIAKVENLILEQSEQTLRDLVEQLAHLHEARLMIEDQLSECHSS